jgi:uncharacterized iron-regulated protein
MTRALASAALALTLVQADAANPVNLRLGEPSRRDRTVALAVDAIVDTTEGRQIDAGQAAARLDGVSLLLVGETHDSREAHRVQQRILEALVAHGRRVRIGFEMLQADKQPVLDRWSRGELTEAAFVDEVGWYEHWGVSWRYYREILRLARDRRLPVVGLNVPREIISTVRAEGFDALSKDQASRLPPDIEATDAEHLALFKAYMGGGGAHGSTDADAWAGLQRAQATWDAVMARYAVAALGDAPDPQTIVVVLAGSGHVAYGLGIERQARRSFRGRIATLVPVAMPLGSATSVSASLGNIVWGVLEEPAPLYPALGASLRRGTEGVSVSFVEPGSPAATSGLSAGDTILEIDGQKITTPGTVGRLIGEKDWGDGVDALVRRDGADRPLRILLRRQLSKYK